MMTIKRRLLAYAKQTTRANFTPAQRRRMLKKARQWGNQPEAIAAVRDRHSVDDVTDMVLLAKSQELPYVGAVQQAINDILTREPTP